MTIIMLKLNIAIITSAAGTGPGRIVVTVRTQSNSYLGRTLFTYFDEDEQWLEQMVGNKKLQGKFFKKLYEKCESDESDESDGKRRKQDSGNSGEWHPFLHLNCSFVSLFISSTLHKPYSKMAAILILFRLHSN